MYPPIYDHFTMNHGPREYRRGDPRSARIRPSTDESGELTRGATSGGYILLDKLGAGGMGVVYAAHGPELARKRDAFDLSTASPGDTECRGHRRRRGG